MRTANERTRGEEKVQTKSERDLHHFLRGYGREDKRRLEKRVGKKGGIERCWGRNGGRVRKSAEGHGGRRKGIKDTEEGKENETEGNRVGEKENDMERERRK